jgi:hypothetical protein
MKKLRTMLGLLGVLGAGFSLNSCDRGDVERAGEKVERGAEKAGDAIEKAGDKIQEKTDRDGVRP